MPIVKRYPNRKLYDTEAKSYVTLDELTRMIRDGEDVQVIDHESGDDLTTLTLTQIILEQEKKSADGFLPRSLLTSLIRTGGDTLEQLLRSVQFGLIRPGGDGAPDAETGNGLENEPTDEAQAENETDASQTRSGDEESPDDWQEDILHMFKMPSQRDMQDLRVQLAILNERLDEVLENKSSDSATVDDPDEPYSAPETG